MGYIIGQSTGNKGGEIAMDNTVLERGMKVEKDWLSSMKRMNQWLEEAFFPHKNIHKTMWESPNGRTKNQIDHFMFSQRWRSLLQDVRAMRGADVNSDHLMILAKVRIKLANMCKHWDKKNKV